LQHKVGFLTKLDRSIDAVKSVFQSEIPPIYSELSNGDHTYNMETERHGLLGFLGLGSEYYSPSENLKWYYENVSFFSDCINLYADIASQVRIQEVDSSGNIVENSEFVKLLDQPNEWQDGIAFIKELVINTLCSGINVQYGNFFKNGNLRINPNLYNIDFFNLSMPKIKNPYILSRAQIQDLKFIEKLEGNEKRDLRMFELAFVYDTIAKNTYSGNGFNSSKFLDPISRVFSLRKDLQVLVNTTDTMAFLSGKNVNWIVSKNSPTGSLAPLGGEEKADIERQLSGNGRYGSKGRKSDIVATNEDLSLLNLTRDNRKMQMIEMQNNAKENVRSRYGIPRDLLDAFTGSNSGSTYENQQFAEARFTSNNVKNITDSWLYSLEKKNPSMFENRGHKLIGTYDHMPSLVAINSVLKNNGFKAKADALMKFLEAFEKSKGLGVELDYDAFLRENGFEEFLKTQSTQ